MPQSVSDIRANLNENITHAAKIIGRSVQRRKIFEEIYRGKMKIKSVTEIAKKTGIKKIRVLQEGGWLAANHIVQKTKKEGKTAYQKEEIYTHHKQTILSILDKPEKAKKYPTKQSPKISGTTYNIKVSVKKAKHVLVTIDDIDSFKQVRQIKKKDDSLQLNKIPESKIKEGIKKIIGETQRFKDWGGEKNDLYTNKIRYKGKRRLAAFALKGKATKGTLTPNKMGKNGDQISRLVASSAEMFFVVYHGKIDESIVTQLEAFALAKSISGKSVYYGVIDGDDLNRLYQAYEDDFK